MVKIKTNPPDWKQAREIRKFKKKWEKEDGRERGGRSRWIGGGPGPHQFPLNVQNTNKFRGGSPENLPCPYLRRSQGATFFFSSRVSFLYHLPGQNETSPWPPGNFSREGISLQGCRNDFAPMESWQTMKAQNEESSEWVRRRGALSEWKRRVNVKWNESTKCLCLSNFRARL